MSSFKKIKEILNLQEQDYFGGAGNPFADVINKEIERHQGIPPPPIPPPRLG